MKDYKIGLEFEGGDMFTLVIALIVLAFTEILKISHAMKEEQDLTV